MARSTENLYEPQIIITDQFDFYSLYNFRMNQSQTQNFLTEVIPAENLYPHVAQHILHQKIGFCIKDDVYRDLVKYLLSMNEFEWRIAQIRQNRVKLSDNIKEIIMIALVPGCMHPENMFECQNYNHAGALRFISITNNTPAYQLMPA